MATSRKRATVKGGPQPLVARIAAQKITDLGFSSQQLKPVSSKVRSLTVGDLQDFARAMEGVKTSNKAVIGLTATDIKGIEDLFSAYRSAALEAIATSRGSLANTENLRISVSCCCCTPCCCCCGAADVNPFEA